MSNIVQNDNVKYEYRCHIIEPSPLYKKNSNKINITYLLSSRTYAEYYKYDTNIATDKDILRANHTRHKQPDYYDTFMNDVRRVCLEHQNSKDQLQKPTNNIKSPVNNTTYRISKKRKREDIINVSPHDPCITPPKIPRKSTQAKPKHPSQKNKKK